MAGRGQVDLISKKENPRVLMMNKDNQWVAATDPLHFDKPDVVGVGPGISFATEMLDKSKKIKIGLIPCALGGSPIKVWKPGASYLKVFRPYDDAVYRAKLAMEKGVLKGILRHQGGSDNDSARASAYIDKLKSLIAGLRKDLQQPNIPFIAGEIGYFNKNNFINSVILELPDVVPYTAIVSAKGLRDKGDRLHFDTNSARELGKRYADAMKNLNVDQNPK